VRGKTLGIVGYGNIGTQLSVMAEALGMEVCFYDVVTRLPLGNARMMPTLEELLERADVVTLHVPETPLTQGMMGAAQLARMKRGAVLVNASRGTVVDMEAAAAALEDRHLGGAAFDVFPREPEGNDEEFVSPLRRFENVILTPHIAGSTVEAQANIGTEVSEKLVRYSDNGSTISAVNFPEVSLPEHPGSHRLLHIHHNVPGVLSRINSVFSQNHINISGEYLMTNAKIGYVVMDVEAESSRIALTALRDIEATIRTRVLF
jgi:D-3-phosphoglycerate dehydrogenase